MSRLISIFICVLSFIYGYGQNNFFGSYYNLDYSYVSTIGFSETKSSAQFGRTTLANNTKAILSRSSARIDIINNRSVIGKIELGKILSEPKIFRQEDKYDIIYTKYYNPKNSGSTAIVQLVQILNKPVITVFEFETTYDGLTFIYMTTVSGIELNETTLNSLFNDFFSKI